MAPYYNRESIKRALIQLLRSPSIILPEPLSTTLPREPLCPSYLHHNFGVKLAGGKVFGHFSHADPTAPCVQSVGNKEAFKKPKAENENNLV